MGGKSATGKTLNLSLSPTCCALPAKEKPLPMAQLMPELKTGARHNTELRDEILPGLASVLNSCESLLNPQTLLQLLESFALFSTVKTGKILHLNALKFCRATRNLKQQNKSLNVFAEAIQKGLIWHFRGSGKSLLMLYAAKMLRADNALKTRQCLSLWTGEIWTAKLTRPLVEPTLRI